MRPQELKARTKRFSEAIVAFCTPLLVLVQVRDIARQLLRAGTAVDANYGSAQCGRSHKDFTAKVGTVYDDANESYGWLDLLKSSGLVPDTDALRFLHREANWPESSGTRIAPREQKKSAMQRSASVVGKGRGIG